MFVETKAYMLICLLKHVCYMLICLLCKCVDMFDKYVDVCQCVNVYVLEYASFHM